MPSSRRNRQLQLELISSKQNFSPLHLSFKIRRKAVDGVLHGNANNWSFESNSPIFLTYIPAGKLDKYALWDQNIPPVISELYNAIFETALKAGLCLQEKETSI